MKKLGFLMMLAGVAMGIGSCGLVGRSFQRALDSRLVYSTPITVGQQEVTELLTVSSERSCQVSVKADITSPSVQEKTDGDEKKYEARYRFPVSYQVEDDRGNVLFREQCDVAWEGQRSVTTVNERVDSTGGSMTAEHCFQKFDVPAPGKVKLTVQVSPDTEYSAQATGLSVRLYDNVSRHGSSMLGAGLMSCSSPVPHRPDRVYPRLPTPQGKPQLPVMCSTTTANAS